MSLNNLRNRFKELAKKQQEVSETEKALTVEQKFVEVSPHEQLAVKITESVKQVGKSGVTKDMLNAEQLQAVQYAELGQSFCLIGSAGTGKTTTQRIVVQTLQESGKIRKLNAGDITTESKIFGCDMPAIGIFSFTNKAVSNIKDALPEEYKRNASTFHMALEFGPVFEEVEVVDEFGMETGTKTTMRFLPKFGKTADGEGGGNFLPHLDVVIVEEAGSVPEDLYNNFISALPHPDKTLFIFLGDLNQLPPVFGEAILGFKLLDLPIVELVTPYRAALESPITNLANKIKDGIRFNDEELKAFEELNANGKGTIKVKPFTSKAKNINPEKMGASFGSHLYNWVMDGTFNPEDTVMLIPYNKAFGTIELNKWVGQARRDKLNLLTYHVSAGDENHYLCEGDRVMYNKQECEIVKFENNQGYTGSPTLAPSEKIDRWGRNKSHETLAKNYLSIDEMLDRAGAQIAGDKVRQASHTIHLRVLGTESVITASTAGEVNSFIPTAVMTVHKAQGSEWRKVIFVIHESHKVLWKRELVYTAITRAREELEIYYTGQFGKSHTSAFQIGVMKSEYGSTTLEGKLDYFRRVREAKKLKGKNDGDIAKYSKGL